MKIKGHMTIYDTKTGKILREADNLVVTAGLVFMAGYLSGGTLTAMSHMAVGSGSTSPAAGDTDLTSLIQDRHAFTATATTSGNQIKFTANWGAGHATGNWYEAGIFNHVSTGTMLCHITYGLLTKAAGDDFTIDYTISFADDGA